MITDREKGVKYPWWRTACCPTSPFGRGADHQRAPTVTADTGIDVFTHAVEAFVSTEATDFSDAAAEKAIKLVKRHLLPAYQNPEDRKARQGCTMPPAWRASPSPTPAWASTTAWPTPWAPGSTSPMAGPTASCCPM